MEKLSRRGFLKAASVATIAAAASRSLAAPLIASHGRQRVFVASGTADGILAYVWHPANGELAPDGVAAQLGNVAWITSSGDGRFLFAASAASSFNGKATGEVASFRVLNGELQPISAQNSAGAGTCHVALDQTGRVLLAADYNGGSAASFLVTDGKLSPAVWNEIYIGSGPNKDRQEKAHAHFASFSPDNRFAYINDLGGDCIHIYWLNSETAALTSAGSYRARAGAGPRTLHFYPNEHTAYSVNELDSTVDVLEWRRADGSLRLITRIELLPKGYDGPTRACDTVISQDGRFVYFANRDNNFLYSFRANSASGGLTPIARSNCGGRTPRNFVLDPTENWMLVANQDSNLISVFRRDTVSGALAGDGKSFAAAAPMRILFA
ncbi:MAG: lactonase family protein [Terracidiphilus sp.]|jgi:6-phosphogluconolactonase